MANSSSSLNIRYTITTILLFLVLFILTIFLFSKRTIQPPALSVYTDFFPQTKVYISLPDSTPPPHPEPVGLLTQPPVSPISQNDTIQSGTRKDKTKDPGHYSEPVGLLVDNGAHKLMQSVKKCDLFMGSWVKDEGYPIYKPGSCPYVDEAFDCQSNGRRDSDYLKWRWKPDACDLPRY